MTSTVSSPTLPRLDASYRFLFTLTVALSAALLTLSAHAQALADSAAAAATQQTAAPSATPVVAATPKYSAQEITRAFGFIDANRDDKLSREEAAGFRGVAKHFDEADLNKDGFLSRQEFENAVNR